MVGRLSMGTLSDRFNVWNLATATLVLTCLSTFILWGVLSYSLAGVLALGVVYGCTAGGWTSMWTALIRPVSSMSSHYNNNNSNTDKPYHDYRKRPCRLHVHIRATDVLPRCGEHSVNSGIDCSSTRPFRVVDDSTAQTIASIWISGRRRTIRENDCLRGVVFRGCDIDHASRVDL